MRPACRAITAIDLDEDLPRRVEAALIEKTDRHGQASMSLVRLIVKHTHAVSPSPGVSPPPYGHHPRPAGSSGL